jgi:hypothetical protein
MQVLSCHVTTLQAREAGLQPLVEWQGHELEAWMAHWDRHQVSICVDVCYVWWCVLCSHHVVTLVRSSLMAHCNRHEAGTAAPVCFSSNVLLLQCLGKHQTV